METLVLLQPALYVFVLVRRVVIADQVDLLAGRHGLIDHTQEAEPLLMPVLLLAQAEDLAIGGVERSKQGRRSIALIVVRHGGAAALLHRQTGLGAVKCVWRQVLVSGSSRPRSIPTRVLADSDTARRSLQVCWRTQDRC